VVGRKGAAWRADQDASWLRVDGAAVGTSLPPLPGLVEIRSDRAGARVTIDGRPAGSVEAGMVLAVFSPSGAFGRALEFPEGRPLDVPFQEALYELRGETDCVDVTAEGWRDVTAALHTGGVVVMLPQMGAAVVEISLPALARATSSLLLGEGVTGLDRSVEANGNAEFAWTLNRTGERRPLFRLALDAPVPVARARLRAGGAAHSVKMCAHRPSRPLIPDGGNEGRLLGDFESEAFFGAGWGGAERTSAGVVRKGGSGATLLLPIDSAYSYRLVLDLEGIQPFTLPITVNGSDAGSCAVSGVTRCELNLPRTSLRIGTNTVALGRGDAQEARPFTFLGGWLVRRPHDP
jgi:hypothetical protein